ncbi:hypothetical protein K523DRAFT_421294 [Schizophyllum commune Tattone D]|nr:hypothetical protein K523DRAFT_421294 [Schizophyllum commune Tattone D]
MTGLQSAPGSPKHPNSGCSISKGVPDTFDFVAHKADVAEIEDYSLTMNERHDLNKEIQARNDESRKLTTKCKTNRAAHPDVGPAIEPLYAYSTEEVMQCYALKFTWPELPSNLVMKLALIDAGILGKKMEKHDNQTKDVLLKPRAHQPIGRVVDTAVPTVVLAAIGHGVYPPLTFLSNHNLTLLTTGASLPTITLSSLQYTDITKAPKVIDYGALIRRGAFPNDIDPYCITFHDWLQLTKRLIGAIQARTDYSTPLKPGECYLDVELSLHFDFFAQFDDAQSLFVAWYPFERQHRYEILAGKAFNAAEYNGQWYPERSKARGDVARYRSPWSPGGPEFKPGLGYEGAAAMPASAYTQVGVTRPHPYSDSGPRKAQKTSHNAWAGAPAPAAPFPAPTAAQPAAAAGGQGGFRTQGATPPTCLACAEGHRARDHDTTSPNIWKDKTPRYATVVETTSGRNSLVRASDGKPICVNWNLKAGKCALPDGHDGGRLHVCAWCGGDHPALSRDGSCARVKDGRVEV